MPRQLRAHPFAVFVIAPLVRMADMPLLPAVIATGFVVNLAQAVASDPFSLVLPAMVAASIFDWWYGRKQARLAGTFRAEVAAIGLHQKIGAIGIVCFVRWLEAISGGQLDTNGMAAVVLGLGLIIEELSSVDEKRVASGAKPIFLLSALLVAVRGALQRLFAAPQK